ncbi:MAG: glycoside hydrolase family 73 protein [Candidatus Methanospirareceae archaeon]
MVGSEFILKIADALLYLGSLGYDVLAVASHAALETGWGKSELFQKHNNMFGIKGDGVPYETVEYFHGRPERVGAVFKTYDSILDCAKDYHELIYTNYPLAYRYRDNAYMYFLALQKEGYATDPKYFTKLCWIYNYLKGGEK